ncbi:MAG: hypothetical protein ACK4K3_07490 [Aquabacterium sp.]
MHPLTVVNTLVSQGVTQADAELAVYGSPAPAPAPATVALDFDSDEPLPICPMRNNGDEICEGCQ